tara:strand:- start:8781 stop:9137 length:357 start_codon:yes stop_codon:yes gene_type:complete
LRPDRDHHAERLRNRFRAVSNRAMRGPNARRFIRIWGLRLVVVSTVLALAWFAISSLSPWPVPMTLRHLAASYDCDMARTVKLAPARRGEPGYWPGNDADDDGIACEVWPPAGRRARG